MIEWQQDQEQKQHCHLRTDATFKKEEPKEDKPNVQPRVAVETDSEKEKATVDVRSKVLDVKTPTIQWPVPKVAMPKPAEPPPMAPSPQPLHRRSKRESCQPLNFTYTKPGDALYLQFVRKVAALEDSQTTKACVAYWTMISVDLTPMGLKATQKGKDPDTPTWEEAMTGPH